MPSLIGLVIERRGLKIKSFKLRIESLRLEIEKLVYEINIGIVIQYDNWSQAITVNSHVENC
jgi:hypothetical protein